MDYHGKVKKQTGLGLSKPQRRGRHASKGLLRTIYDAFFARFFSALHPFLQAAVDGNGEKIKAMLRRDPELVYIRDEEFGSTALHKASTWGEAGVAAILLAHRSEVDAIDLEGSTPLHRAAEQGHADVLGVLLTKRANVNAKDNEGLTPLHKAARSGSQRSVELLLARGAKVNAVDLQGMTPLDWAEEAREYFSEEDNGYGEVVTVLRQSGGCITAKEKENHEVATMVPAGPTPDSANSREPSERVGRNDPCPCGSGKKYKKCHGAEL